MAGLILLLVRNVLGVTVEKAKEDSYILFLLAGNARVAYLRAREGRASRITSVHLVSAVRDWGLKNLIDEVRELVGPRGNLWAIVAHNAGNSTLINAIAKHINGNATQLTEAFGGILSANQAFHQPPRDPFKLKGEESCNV
ncbi:hypothetical protein Scep_010487 [Stephania cephalantha]|uniref:Uncharacterized protein n=1 Tax=Stephania cephalantha TaxID=152367 RepID=A0AAP0JVI3_9MAGN